MLSRYAEIFGAALLLCVPLFGIDRDLRIDQLHHTSWNHNDGVPSQILTLAQTTDGFLWIGARDGLYRFDGIHFERYQPPNETLPNAEVSSLLAASDGGLWIGFTRQETSFLKDGRISTYPEPAGFGDRGGNSLARDDQGVIWRSSPGAGLSRLTGSRWEKVGAEWGFSGGAYGLYVDRAGTLWVDTFHGLVFLPKGARQFQRPASLASGWGPFAESHDGTLWILDWTPSTVPKIRSAASGLVLREFDRRARVYKMIVDRQQSLWVGTAGNGIHRTQYPERANAKGSQEMRDTADVFRQKDGLSGDTITALLEDREGDIWVATNRGLDRFRQSPLITVRFPADALGFTLSARENGEVWATSWLGQHPLLAIRDGRVTALQPLSSPHIHSSFRDPNGLTWVGTESGLLRYSANKVDRIELPGPPSKSTDVFPFSITMDSDGRLVVLFAGRRPKRLENGQWADLVSLGFPATGAVTLASDAAGRVWVGCTGNRIALLEGSKVTTFTSADGVNVGNVDVIASRRNSIWIAGLRGLQQYYEHRFAAVAPADGGGFRGVRGILTTADNGMWLGEDRGIIHIEEAETRRLERNPEYRVKYQVFDGLDGLSDGIQSHYPEPNMIEGTDGRLWFATAQGVVWLDPKRIPTRPLPPTSVILSITANEHTYGLPASEPIKLPPHTVNLQFAYTAPGLAIPERVRFRYKLEGSDKEWRDAGLRREASYTNLGPGSYRFHLIASNGEGIWNQPGAVTAFIIQPALYQTHWFYAFCVCAALGLLGELYRLRLRQISARLSAQMQGRLEVRFAERERIARELHDTLLQGFQGLTLHFQAVMEQIPDREPARQSMKKALTYADAVLLEGRQRVRELRPEGSDIHELSQQIAAYGEELAKDRAIAFNVTVVGSPQPLHPVVSDEIYRIAREGLANAFRHSQASKIEVEITYHAASVCLRVRDDGDGIGPEILESGKEGHWGLSGMRERAHNIGAQLNILSNPGSGTEVDLTLPAKVAYVGTPEKRRWYWIARNKSGGR